MATTDAYQCHVKRGLFFFIKVQGFKRTDTKIWKQHFGLVDISEQHSANQAILPENESILLPEAAVAAAVPVLQLYYQITKIHLVAGGGRSSTKVVLPDNKNPSGWQRRPFQC